MRTQMLRACRETGVKREGSRTKTSHDKSVFQLYGLLKTLVFDKPYGFSFS